MDDNISMILAGGAYIHRWKIPKLDAKGKEALGRRTVKFMEAVKYYLDLAQFESAVYLQVLP